MAEESSQERTEEPTERRRSDVRKKGQVPRSRELNTFLSLVGAAGGMMLMGDSMVTGLMSQLANGLALSGAELRDPNIIFSLLKAACTAFILLLLPFMLLMVIVSVAGPIGLGGWLVSFEALQPKFEKVNPLKGLGRIFSVNGLMELAKAILKFLLVGTVAVLIISQVLEQLVTLGSLAVTDALRQYAGILLRAFIGLSSALLLVVVFDVPFQLQQFTKQIRMTRQEIKDELKETEGRPEVKSRIRELQRDASRRRMIERVPDADVVITNPTHYAVALKYDQQEGAAPKVIAKGRNLIAGQIRKAAQDHGVALFPSPPLARALYASTEIDAEVPVVLYVAVAQVLAYIFKLREAVSGSEDYPEPPDDLPVPDDLVIRDPEG